MANSLENCIYMSDLADYDNGAPLSYSHLHLKSKLNTTSGDIIVNIDCLPIKYFDIIKKNAQTITLDDVDFINYKYQPKKFCYDKLGSIELWSILLRLNNMTSISEFNVKTFKIPPSNIFELLNEILILESDNIIKNKMSIE